MTIFKEGNYRVATPSVRILLEPHHHAVMDEQALMGEELTVLDATGEFSPVSMQFSGKRGWVASAAQKLIPVGDGLVPTYRVALPRVITFRRPNAESGDVLVLPLNAHVTLGERACCGNDEFARVLGFATTIEAWVRTSALMLIGTYESDFVAVQQSLLGTPYLWGGRDSTVGLDCSRLVGESYRATGQAFCPGDTKDQVTSTWLGGEMEFPHRGLGLLRGDLIFWKGHVATMIDARRCIHATDLAPHHRVLEQDLSEVITQRVEKGKGLPVLVRRSERYQRDKLKSLVA